MNKRDKLWMANQYLLFGALMVTVLYFAQVVLIPLVFGILLAMLMAPLCRFFDERGFKRYMSTFFCVFIIFAGFLGLIWMVAAQISAFSDELPRIEQKTEELLTQIQAYVQYNFNVSPERQIDFVREQIRFFIAMSGGQFFDVVEIMTATGIGLMLTLVYTFLFLYHKERYIIFILKLYKDQESEKIREIVDQISHVSQQYLTGRAISVFILAILYAIGLLSVGLENAVLLACIAASLTIIPYVGTFVGGLFPFLMALITEDSVHTAVWVAAILTFVQIIDNYFIEPNVVGGEVNLSAFASIFIIIVGGLLWGVPGMVLFVPMLGIVKIIFDHVENLKPYGYLVGNPNKGHNYKTRVKTWVWSGSAILFQKLKLARKN